MNKSLLLASAGIACVPTLLAAKTAKAAKANDPARPNIIFIFLTSSLKNVHFVIG